MSANILAVEDAFGILTLEPILEKGMILYCAD
jgi:hypothetical protein